MAYRPRNRVWSAESFSAGIVPLLELKDHLRVSSESEDLLIVNLGLVATAAVERWTQRLLVQRQAVLRLTALPSGQCPIELPGGQVASISSVIADGATITGCTPLGEAPAVLLPSADWPLVTGTGYPVTITYQAGYTAPPFELSHAVKMIAAELYERRSNGSADPITAVPVNAEALMAPYRIWAAA